MVPAKKFGVKVTQYMVGFGPTLWSRSGRHRVRRQGHPARRLHPHDRHGAARARTARARAGRAGMATAVEDFRQASRAEVEPGDEHRQFYRLTPGKKMIVMLGGPTMNLVIYLVLTVVLLTHPRHAERRRDHHRRRRSASAWSPADLAPAANAAPARSRRERAAPASAGLQPGDQIVADRRRDDPSWDQVGRRSSSRRPASRCDLDGRAQRRAATLHGHAGREPQVRQRAPAPRRRSRASSASRRRPPLLPGAGASPAMPGQIGSQIGLGVDALGSYPEKIGSLCRHRLRGQAARPERRRRRGRHRPARRADSREQPRLDLQDKIYTLSACWRASTCCCSSSTCCRCCPWTAATSPARWSRRPSAAAPGCARGARLRRRRRRPAPRAPIFVDTAQMLPVMYAVASVLVC